MMPYSYPSDHTGGYRIELEDHGRVVQVAWRSNGGDAHALARKLHDRRTAGTVVFVCNPDGGRIQLRDNGWTRT